MLYVTDFWKISHILRGRKNFVNEDAVASVVVQKSAKASWKGVVVGGTREEKTHVKQAVDEYVATVIIIVP